MTKLLIIFTIWMLGAAALGSVVGAASAHVGMGVVLAATCSAAATAFVIAGILLLAADGLGL